MKASSIIILVAMTVALGLVSPSHSQENPGRPVDSPAENADDAPDDSGKFGLHYQVGGFMTAWTNIEGRGKANYLVTGDLVGLKWSRTESTFGLGLHFTFDENGHRLGIKGLWRTPLIKGRAAYLQFAPGVYVSATDSVRPPRSPGYFLEVELGLHRYFALVGALEVLPYEGYRVGWDHDNDRPLYSSEGYAKSMYFGAKVGQWPGLVATIAGVAIGGLVLASSLNSSFY